MKLSISILTISDTRHIQSDISGQQIQQMLEADGLNIVDRKVIPDDIKMIRQAFTEMTGTTTNCIITNGGTGIAKRDVTYEALASEICQEIPGFGEFFRYLSFKDIGTHAMASRAFAGFNGKDQLVFCLPGSTKACQLAVKELILPEIRHLIKERQKTV